MSVSLRKFAWWHQVDPRTARRWCEGGKVPGAYRTTGGHWRLRRMVRVKHLKKRSRRNWTTRLLETPAVAAALTFRKGETPFEILEAAKASLFINDTFLVDDPTPGVDLDRLPREIITPEGLAAARDQKGKLGVAMAVETLRRQGRRATGSAIASVLGVSRATLYRHSPEWRKVADALTVNIASGNSGRRKRTVHQD